MINTLYIPFQKSNRGIVMVSFYADHINCNGMANVTHIAGNQFLLQEYYSRY